MSKGQREMTYEELKYAYMKKVQRVQELEKRIADDEHFISEILEQNKRYKQALEEISNADWNSEGLDAERELDMVTDVAFKALEGEE